MKNKTPPKQPKNLSKPASVRMLAKSQPPGKKKGFSLIELLLIIGFSTGATALAFVAYKSWTDSNNADLASQTLSQISKGAQSISAVSLDYAALETSPAGLLPSTVFDRVTNAPINSPWGAISITLSQGAKPRDSYTVLFANATPNGCTRTILKNYQDYSQVSVNRSVVWTMGDAPLDPAVAGSACAVGQNEVAFQSMTLMGSMPTPSPTPTLMLAANPMLPSPIALASIPAAAVFSPSAPAAPSPAAPGPAAASPASPSPAASSPASPGPAAASPASPSPGSRPAQTPGITAQVAAAASTPWLTTFMQSVGLLQAPVQLAVLPVVMAPPPPPVYVAPITVPASQAASTIFTNWGPMQVVNGQNTTLSIIYARPGSVISYDNVTYNGLDVLINRQPPTFGGVVTADGSLTLNIPAMFTFPYEVASRRTIYIDGIDYRSDVFVNVGIAPFVNVGLVPNPAPAPAVLNLSAPQSPPPPIYVAPIPVAAPAAVTLFAAAQPAAQPIATMLAPAATVSFVNLSCATLGFPADYTGSVLYSFTTSPGLTDEYKAISNSCVPPPPADPTLPVSDCTTSQAIDNYNAKQGRDEPLFCGSDNGNTDLTYSYLGDYYSCDSYKTNQSNFIAYPFLTFNGYNYWVEGGAYCDLYLDHSGGGGAGSE